MKRFFLLVVALVAYLMPLSAQEFIINPWGGDEVECSLMSKGEDGKWEFVYEDKKTTFPEGFTFTAIDSIDDNNYFVFEHEGKFYSAKSKDLQFSPNNPDDVENPLSEKVQKRASLAGDFYGSMAAAYVVLLLLATAAIVTFIYRFLHIKLLRPIVLTAIPAAILLMSLIIIFGYWKFESDIFWWCDYDRYGFFSSLFRVIPFMLAVLAQVYSIRLYENVIFDGNEYDEEGNRLKISIKPMAWSIILCIPVTLGFFIVMALMGWHNNLFVELLAVALFFITLGLGFWRTYKKNIKTMGFFNGLFVSTFSIVYIIGCIISALALIVLIFQLIFQILAVLGAFLVLACVIPKRTYRRSDGVIVEEY